MKRILPALVLGLSIAVPAAPANAAPRPVADFDGDGYGDVAVGAVGEQVGEDAYAGAVNVLYGSPTGLSGTGAQQWHQDSAGIEGGAERSDNFGHTLAHGDFDGDGYSDLAVSAAFETVGAQTHAGVVHVLYGSPSGLRATGSELWTQANAANPPVTTPSKVFGFSLAVGDLDADGRDDLAIGAPYRTDADGSGPRVFVLFGSAGGLRPGESYADPDGKGDSLFGYSLATGRFDGTAPDDLAVGAPDDSTVTGSGTARTVVGAGRVWVLPGSPSGPQLAGRMAYDLDTPGVPNRPEDVKGFGTELAAGDFDGDGRADLAIGVPRQKVGTSKNAGAVYVLRGSGTGLTGSGAKVWHQSVSGVPGVPEPTMNSHSASESDGFGRSLAAGDFDNDSRDDLAIGAPQDDVVTTRDGAGTVTVLYGTANGLTTAGVQLWHQSVAGVHGSAEEQDSFGSAVGVTDANRDGRDDLVVGVPGEDLPGRRDAGVVHVLPGRSTGVGTSGAWMFHQDTPGVPGAVEWWDRLGSALA